MIRILAAVLLCVGQLATAEPMTLLDGSSLAGWKPVGDIEWSLAEGAVVASGSGDGFLVTEKTYDDFYLRVEFWVDETTNSGIFIRCRDRSRIHPETCYELNIWDKHPKQEARTGSIVFEFMPPMAQVNTIGRWNTYEITAVGGKLDVKVNGVTTAVLEDVDPTPGFFALQHWEQGTVKFRKVELAPR
jgi:hypothetical protein